MVRNNKRLFGGAGVIVRRPGGTEEDESIIVVETEHATEVSELIFSLKGVFADCLDYFNKYEFYGRLAEAANGQIVLCDDFAAIREAVVGEACVMAAEMGAHLYFAYGSNMDEDQMALRCPESVFVGTAALPGYGFELDSAGVATVVERCDSVVRGVMWLISASDEARLDRYEGVASGCYRKATLQVIDEVGCGAPALVYVSNRDAHDGATHRMGYMDNIVSNAIRLGFGREYVAELESKWMP